MPNRYFTVNMYADYVGGILPVSAVSVMRLWLREGFFVRLFQVIPHLNLPDDTNFETFGLEDVAPTNRVQAWKKMDKPIPHVKDKYRFGLLS